MLSYGTIILSGPKVLLKMMSGSMAQQQPGAEPMTPVTTEDSMDSQDLDSHLRPC